MSTSAKRRPRRPAQDSLRPGWMLNSILFCVLLASIGACYVWLGVKKKDRADQILNLHREIELIGKQIQEKNMHISRRLDPEELRARLEQEDFGLKPINISKREHFIRLPDPAPVGQPSPEAVPLAGKKTLAGIRQP